MRGWIAGLLAVGLLGGCAATGPATAAGEPPAAERIDGTQARALVAEGAFLLDVRTPEEFAEGHVEGATNIPVQTLAERVDEVPSDRPVIVYCASGRRSAKAAAILGEAGHEQIHDLGGIANW